MFELPPKQRINREIIMENAYKVLCRDGMENVNARSVAREIGCSTQPIFSYYTGMGELKQALEERANSSFEAVMHPAMEEKPLLPAVCGAYLDFAAEEPQLFRYLFVRMRAGEETIAFSRDLSQGLLEKVAAQYGLDEKKAKTLCATLSAYCHGLAVVLATGLFPLTLKEAGSRLKSLVVREVKVLQ